MSTPHPAHDGMPALYMAEALVRHGRWSVIVTGPDLAVVTEEPIDLGPADDRAVSDGSEPGRGLIAHGMNPTPVLPAAAANAALAPHGFVISPQAVDDPSRARGWTEVADGMWTAPCHPTAS